MCEGFNIPVIGIPTDYKRENGLEKHIWVIMDKNFPNWLKTPKHRTKQTNKNLIRSGESSQDN